MSTNNHDHFYVILSGWGAGADIAGMLVLMVLGQAVLGLLCPLMYCLVHLRAHCDLPSPPPKDYCKPMWSSPFSPSPQCGSHNFITPKANSFCLLGGVVVVSEVTPMGDLLVGAAAKEDVGCWGCCCC